MRRTPATLLLVVSLAVGACRSDNVASPEPTVRTAPSSTTIAATGTTVAHSFAVPQQIDAAYVDQVLVALNKVYGDVVRKIRVTGQYERSDLDPLRAIFNDPLLELQAAAFDQVVTRDALMYRDPIGDRRLAVEELITVRQDCIFARVQFDVSAVATNPPAASSRFITLRPTQADADPDDVNPTPWSMSGESDARQDQCAD